MLTLQLACFYCILYRRKSSKRFVGLISSAHGVDALQTILSRRDVDGKLDGVVVFPLSGAAAPTVEDPAKAAWYAQHSMVVAPSSEPSGSEIAGDGSTGRVISAGPAEPMENYWTFHDVAFDFMDHLQSD